MVKIRECVEGDLETLERRMPTGGHNAHAQHFAGQQRGTCTYLTAWEDRSPVGCCLILWEGCVEPEVRRALPEAVEISNVHVYSEARGRGIGSAMIRSAEQYVVARGGRVITIGVAEDNPRASALYARLGYRDTGLRSTARYSYRDQGGIDRQMIEHNRTLAKRVDEG